MKKILVVGKPGHGELFASNYNRSDFEFVIIDNNNLPENIEELKKTVDKTVILQDSIIPQIPNILNIDEKMYQYEEKRNRKQKKWQRPYKFHK